MLDPVSLAALLRETIDLSDAIYAAHNGNPADASIASREVEEFDNLIAENTGPPGPLFGAYADAEAKLRSLNDLVRSASILLPQSGTSVGWSNVMRAAVETAARLHWILAPDEDHRERAARFLRERLRTVSEISKFDDEARQEMRGYEDEVRAAAGRAGLHVPGPPPAAVDLIVDLMNRDGVLTLSGLNRSEVAVMFYRLPSAPTHAAMHGLAVHHGDPRNDPERRMTKPAPWEQVLLLAGGLFAGYACAHRALLKLYGWDHSEWDETTAALGQRLVDALDAARVGVVPGSAT